MAIIFDRVNGEVYIENPDPRAEGTKYEKDYYYKPKNDSPKALADAQFVVNRMEMMYQLGKSHRSQEIRKILGV
jgi:hypothetical protein